MTREDKIKLFVNEFNYIKDNNLRKFAEEIIANAGDWFFVEPASTSGKYHPKFSLGDGGLMRHTRCVAYWAMCMAESFNMTQEDSDLLVIAALAHDIKKHDDNGHFLRNHPLLASDYVCDIMEKFSEDVITNEQVQKICCAVSSHMGKWEGTREWVKDTTKELFPMPKNDFEKALQAADYIASRKAILDFDFAPIDNVAIPKTITENKKEERDPNTYTIDELHSFVMPFGKHKGKTFKDVKETGYLYWMTLQDDFNAVDVQALAKRYLLLLGEKCGQYPVSITLGTNNEIGNKEVDDLPF
jgi:uncharacterized protein (DUF3820 family)